MGVRRGAAPVAADRQFVKRSPLGTAAVARGLMAREPSTPPFSAANKSSGSGDARPFSISKRQRETAAHGKIVPPPSPKFTKVMRGAIIVKIGGGEALPNARSSLKRPRVMERGGEPDPGQLVDSAVGILRKRMAVELDALHALLRKAELLSRGKNRPPLPAEQRKEAPVEAVSKTMPAAKRMKASPLGNKVAKECEAGPVPAHEENGVSPAAVRCPSPIVSVKKSQESSITPEDEDEVVDICGGVSPIAFQETVLLPLEDAGETGSSPSPSSSSSSRESESSSSSSESDSDSDSDSDEEGNVGSPPAPPVFVPGEKSTAAQPMPMQNTELEEIEQL